MQIKPANFEVMKTKTALSILFLSATSTSALALTKEEIRQSIQQKRPQLQECYDDALKTKQGLGGKLVLSWEISDEGKATKIKVVKSVDKSLDACVIKIVEEVPFVAAPKGITAEVKKYTIDFNVSDKSVKPD